MGSQSGAAEYEVDFILQEGIEGLVTTNRNQQITFYLIELELIDIQTNHRVWEG